MIEYDPKQDMRLAKDITLRDHVALEIYLSLLDRPTGVGISRSGKPMLPPIRDSLEKRAYKKADSFLFESRK